MQDRQTMLHLSYLNPLGMSAHNYFFYAVVLTFLQVWAQAQNSSATVWTKYTDSIAAFELETPVPLKSELRVNTLAKIPYGWKVTAFAGNDKATNIYYMVSISEPIHDLYIVQDSLYMESLRVEQAEKMAARTLDTILKRRGYFTYLQTGKPTRGKEEIVLRSMATVRYNRVITLVAATEQGKETHGHIQRFFNSFRMLPVQKSIFKKQAFGSWFTTYAPAPFFRHEDISDSTSKVVSYNSRDTFSTEVYTALIIKAAEKQWYRTPAEYWDERLGFLTADGDSVLNRKTIYVGEAEGCQVVLWSQGRQKHIRMVPFADSLLIMQFVESYDPVLPAKKQLFFDSLTFTAPYQPTTLFKSGAANLLADLQQTDSSLYTQALERMTDAPFAIADLPLLRDALLKHYPLASYSSQSILHPTEKISEIILNLGDPSIASFAMKNYLPQNGRNSMEQSLLLDLVARDPRIETYQFAANALNKFKSTDSVAQDVFFRLINNPDLLYEVYPDLLPLVHHPGMGDGMLGVINTLLVSDSIRGKDLEQLEPIYCKQLETCIKTPQLDSVDAFYNRTYRLISILGHTGGPCALPLLEQAAVVFNKNLKMQAGIQLARLGKSPGKPFWKKLAEDKTMRYTLYENLEAAGLTVHFPSEYARQEKMAESLLWQFARNEAEPMDIQLLAMQPYTWNGDAVHVFFFVMGFELEDGSRGERVGLAVFAADKTKLTAVNEAFEIDWEAPFNAAEKEQTIERLLKWLQ